MKKIVHSTLLLFITTLLLSGCHAGHPGEASEVSPDSDAQVAVSTWESSGIRCSWLPVWWGIPFIM